MKVTEELLETLDLKLEGNRYVIARNGYFVYKSKLPENAKELIDSIFGYICKQCKATTK